MSIIKTLATLGPLGYMPSSGTVASFVCLPIIAFLTHNYFPFFLVIASWILVASLIIVVYAQHFFVEQDSQLIVVDEVAGIFLTFLSVSFSWPSLVIGFFLFRFFDITKCCGISYLEKLPGAWGIVADDVVAGIYANLLLRALLLVL